MQEENKKCLASAANDQLVKNVVLDNYYVEIDKCAGEVK